MLVGSAGSTSNDGDDTFTATNATYTTNDVLIGGNGNDTLNITATAAVTAASSVVGIETINVTTNGMFSGAAYAATGVVGTVALNLSTTQVGGDGAFAVTGLGETTATITANSNVTGALSLTSAGAAAQSLILAANNASSQAVTLQGNSAADAASVTANGAVTLDTDGVGGNAVETVTLAGNTAAATYTLGTIATAANLVLAGAQSVTVSGTSADFNGKTVTDSTTAGTTTVKVTATTNGNDLSKVSADVIEVTTVTAGGDDLIFKATGANLKVSATANRLDLIAGTQAATATDDSITILATGATTVIGNATGGAGGAAGTAGAYETVNYSATVADAAVNTATLTLGAGTALNLSGSNAITLAATSTAKSVTHSGSGALTVTFDGTNDIATVTGGSGNDVFNVAVAAASTATIDGGTGTADKVVFDTTRDATGLTLNNIDWIALDDGTATVNAIDFKASQLSGKSWIVTGNGAANDTIEINANESIDTLTINLSGLVIDSATVGKITVDGTKVAPAFGAAAAQTFTGSSIADDYTGNQGADVISTGAGADLVLGGLGNDTITLGEGSDAVAGGAGADTIVLTETTSAADYVTFLALTDGSAAGAAAGTFTGYDVITGFATTVDKLVFDSTATVAADTTVGTKIADAKIVKAMNDAASAANDLTAADFTNVDKVVAFLNDLSQAYTNTGNDVVAVTFGTFTALYAVNDSGSDDTLVATEIKLLGTVDAVLVAGDLVIA